MRGCLPIILAGRISSHYMWTTPDVLWLFCETWVTSAWSSCQYFSNLLYKKLPNLYNSSMQIELTSVSLIRMELLSSNRDFINIYITFHQATSQGCPAGIITYVIKLSLWIWKSFSMFWITIFVLGLCASNKVLFWGKATHIWWPMSCSNWQKLFYPIPNGYYPSS